MSLSAARQSFLHSFGVNRERDTILAAGMSTLLGKWYIYSL